MKTETFKAEGQKGLYDQINLDFERTKRIYRVLGNLSQNTMNQLKIGDLTQFSFSSDKMRPMLSYISDNNIGLSKHLKNEQECAAFEDELRTLSKDLKTNLTSVEAALKAMGGVEFNPVFFSSKELTNAYLDYQLPMAWEFEHDLVTINNLNHTFLLDLEFRVRKAT